MSEIRFGISTPDLNTDQALDSIVASVNVDQESIQRMERLQYLSPQAKQDFLSENPEVAREAAREFVRIYFSLPAKVNGITAKG